MTNIKRFVVGVLLGSLFGATFLGAISHVLVIGLAAVGVSAVVLAARRHYHLPPARGQKDLQA
jgi:uncharacterized protein (DUF2062 family)